MTEQWPPAGRPDFSALNMIGDSTVFKQVLSLIVRLGASDCAVLIQGETGTGKELAARAIHYCSRRRHGPFAPVNCGAIPDSLFENELFGHARGAFTGAIDAQPGLVEEADGGTLFLDEVEALSPRAQAALLRFLHDGTFRKLGGRGLHRAHVRVVAASNANLDSLVQAGGFRADLLYRLKVMDIEMPPLRARGGDAVLLAEHFVRRLHEQYRKGPRLLDRSFREFAVAHAWPGNVRELENLAHRQFLLTDADAVSVPDGCLAARFPSMAPPVSDADFAAGFAAAKARVLDSFERTFVAWALRASGGNVSSAARRAGKERRSFGRLVKKHGLEREAYSR